MKSRKDMKGTANRVVRIGDLLEPIRRPVEPDRSARYRLLGVRLYGAGCRAQEETAGVKAPVLFRVERGDVVYNKMWASKGAFAVVGEAFDGYLVTSEYPVFRPGGSADAEFIRQLLAQSRFWRRCEDLSSGTTSRSRLNPTEFLAMRVSCPPLPEQRRIAAALAGVDRAVAATRTLIDRLRDAKRHVMRELLTHGCVAGPSDCRANEREANPSQWRWACIGDVARVGNGSTPSRKRSDYWTGGTVPWLGSGKVNDYRIRAADEYVTELACRETSIRILPKGTVLIGLIGQGKTRGTVARMEIAACVNQNVAGIVPGDALNGEYLLQWLGLQYEALRRTGRGSGQDALNGQMIKSIRLPFPPLAEQCRIAAVGESFDRRIEKEQAVLARIEDAKQALAQALLSGQVGETKINHQQQHRGDAC